MQQSFLFCRLDQIVIHVGALSLKESQELVCMWVHLGETIWEAPIFMLELKTVSFLLNIGRYAGAYKV